MRRLKDIYDQQQRLEELEDLSDDVVWTLVIKYAGSAYRFAHDDRTHERWEITEKGIKAVKEEDSTDNSEASSELPDNEDEKESRK